MAAIARYCPVFKKSLIAQLGSRGVKVAPNREPPRETSGPQDAQEGVTDAAVRHRFHLHETVAQKAVHEAARRADFR
jgi:hypothetical protein